MRLSPSDVRVAGAVVTLWSIAVVILVSAFGFTNSKFFRFGPGDTVHFFGSPIDSWVKYGGIVFYVAVQQLVQTYGLNTITPFLLNHVQNTKVKTLDESHGTVMAITMTWYFYLWTSRIISIQILLSQIDFLLLILLVDETMTAIATKFFYLNQKQPKPSSSLHSIQAHLAQQQQQQQHDAHYGCADVENGDAGGGDSPWATRPTAPLIYAPSAAAAYYGSTGGQHGGYR